MVRRTTTGSGPTTATTTTTIPIIKKKKGRPSLLDLQNRKLLQKQQQQQQQNPNNNNNNNNNDNRVRSTRRIPNLPAHFLDGSDSDDYDNHDNHDNHDDHDDHDDDDDDDDDERVEKKIKLVVQFPNNNNHNHNKKENTLFSQKNKNEKVSKVTDNNENGTRRILGGLEHGPTTTTTITAASTCATLPDKKLLLVILDKLQKKDTRGVFAEPVDPEELPDYHEIIEHPMDFETVRKKLVGGVYTTLDQLEDDVNLICSNAMQYNAPSTIFFRQARAIQDLAKKEFDVIRQDGGLSEAPPKPRRGRPPGSRNWKKLLESSPPERVATVHESSSEATPASREEDPTKSGSYNLRKGPSLYRFPRSLDYDFDYSGFSASPFKSTSFKYGKKTCGSDESKRDTYFLSCESNSAQDPHSLATFGGFERQLTEVGLASDHSYSRSLARFGADLGPAVWKIISQKISSILPPGVEFGPGWVGDPKMSSTQSNYMSQDSFKSQSHHPTPSGFPSASCSGKPSTSYPKKPVASQNISSNIEWNSLKSGNDNRVVGLGSSMQIQHRNPQTQFQDAMARPTSSPSASLFNNPYAIDSSSSFDGSRNFHGMMSSDSDMVSNGQGGMPYWQNLPIQERWDHPFPVELNRVFQPSSSKSSNLPIGSPPQLDLVLQL